ncbi:DNA-binding transcriptional LysR family regulator [Amaricoccus macauensis]|uniref:DNA-binding transcriptional LysR family regulator n=1 Tax=Amaricoccus macauensis TaxID=57001 RepID=A0A840SEV7_9RHOB|nr:LysR family transcriptional regulator [Amaricoccus macauensis]MBB5221439.1 DNA-binding transcriptional LysR family regulator [Amaricoccus macauensis]
MLDWDDLKVFLGVAREGSTLAAARALGVNQTTVGRRVHALEHALGLTLFARRSTGYALTEHGRSLLPAAEVVELAVNEAVAEAERLRRLARSVVRVTAPEVVFHHLIAHIVAAYHDERPGVTIEQVASDNHLDLAAGEADIAFRATEQRIPETLIARRLPDFGWTVYCSRSYAAENGMPQTPDALREHAAVLYDKPLSATARSRWMAVRVDENRIVARCNTVGNMRGAVRAGMGVGLLPCIDAEQDTGLLRCFAPLPELAGPWYLLMTPELQRLPAVRRFADFAVARLTAQRRLITEGRE